jgi:hypothetical protein
MDPLAGILLYILPLIIALVRGAKHKIAITLLDLLLGWLPVVWVALLIWSILSPQDNGGGKGGGWDPENSVQAWD